MALLFLRRGVIFTSPVNSLILSRVCNLCSRASMILDGENQVNQSMTSDNWGTDSANCSNGVYLSSVFSAGKAHSGGFGIELVDPDTWRISSGLSQAWRETDGALEKRSSLTGTVDEPVDYSPPVEDEHDFDSIEDMRIRGNLFYKLDRDSKEFEEYNFSFRRKKSSKNKDEPIESRKKENEPRESRKKENPNHNSASGGEKVLKLIKNKSSTPIRDMDDACVRKKLRTPTFNQLTDPYHEPFCLDIYISKSSVRACIVHRVTSKVVAVAHSISKDMKFDLASTKDSTACTAIGAALAQRALADDIHDVVYTPRKGEKLEGKLQIVLQSVIDHGINVKVKIKQRHSKKVGNSYSA
ncbi:hypothetical protein HHK36_020605 [Tetracentron sinense]|uniref:Uncharacterized protein n=1 Tax=Tetracentron sinense TaxID=13715 RepID=A0A835DB71_TETSI|nr:hypothetical protein HHK36_020605 [Tetracentron sinense]